MKTLKVKSILQVIVLTILLSLFFTPQSEGQLFKKLKKTVKDAVEGKLDKKVKKKTEDVMDGIFSSSKKKSKVGKETDSDKEEDNVPDIFKKLQGIENVENAKYEGLYKFSTTLTMQIEIFDKKTEKKPPLEMQYSLGENAIANYIHNGDMNMISIVDLKNKSIIMLSPTNKSGTTIPLSLLEMLNNKNEDELDYKIEKTGLSKNIKGHTCYQYLYTDKDFKQELWLAPSLKRLTNSYIKGLSNISKQGKKHRNPYKVLKGNEGFPLEIILYLNNKKTQRITVTNIKESPLTIKTSDYNFEKK